MPPAEPGVCSGLPTTTEARRALEKGAGVPASATGGSPYLSLQPDCPASPMLGKDRGMAGARWLSQGCRFCPSTLTHKTLSWEHDVSPADLGRAGS